MKKAVLRKKIAERKAMLEEAKKVAEKPVKVVKTRIKKEVKSEDND